VDEFELTEKLKRLILPRRLLYGDCFVEVVDLKKEIEKVDLNKSTNVLTENGVNLLSAEIDRFNSSSQKSGLEIILAKMADMLVEVGPDSSILLEQDEDKKDDKETVKLGQEFADVLLKIHKPHNIIILDTEYGTRIGYLEIQKQDMLVHQNIGQSLAKTIGRVTSMSGADKPGEQSQNKIVNKLIYHVLKKVVSKEIKPGMPANDVDTILKSLGEDVYLFIKRMFVEQGLGKKNNRDLKQIRVRFIPSSRMVHFTNPSVDYGSYGESIVESLILPAKLYILSQLANAVTKLSRASVVRKWTLDVGASQMHSQMIQRLKRELYNTRVTLADLSSFKSIPKILSDFKDMFILTKGGQAQVDVDVQSMGDPSIKVADLEDARREIISLSGIPAPYLGYMDMQMSLS